MGMDVYGSNPKIHEGTKKPERPKDLHKASRNVVDKYFKEEDDYKTKNPGVYFRNNCWWWRPLANFMIENCDWLTQEQKERLHDNSVLSSRITKQGRLPTRCKKKCRTAVQPNAKK